MLFKYFFVSAYLMLFFYAFAISAEVLELGESQLHGKKDQPEAMTFVSRAPLDVNGQATKFKGKDKIKEDISRTKLFDLVYQE